MLECWDLGIELATDPRRRTHGRGLLAERLARIKMVIVSRNRFNRD